MAAEIIGSGNVPQRSDTIRLLLVKDTLASAAGGGGGVGQVLSWNGTGSMPTATGAAVLWGFGAADGLEWKKVTAGTNNTDWVGV